MSEEHFSIIIPVYDKERHIERCLSSVFSQSYSKYEIIVVDDGSTDKSMQVLNELLQLKGGSIYQDIRIFRQSNGGVSSARNKGIGEAKYELIALLDADDAWNPLFLETIRGLTEQYPEAGAYATDYDIVRQNGRRYVPHHKYIPNKDSDETDRQKHSTLIPNYFKSMIYGEPMITSSSVCIRKETFEKAGMFPEEERLGEDKDMWARIALEYPIAFSWYIGATYYENADNRTCLRYIPTYERYFIKTLQKKLESNEVPSEFIEDVRKYVSKNLIKLAAKNIKTGNAGFAKRLLKDKRCNLSYPEKCIWTIISYVPFRVLHPSISILKFLRDYPLFYVLSILGVKKGTDNK